MNLESEKVAKIEIRKIKMHNNRLRCVKDGFLKEIMEWFNEIFVKYCFFNLQKLWSKFFFFKIKKKCLYFFFKLKKFF